MRTIDIRPRSFALGYALAVLLASLAVCSGCTIRPVRCSGAEDCPALERCQAGRCSETRR